MSKNKILAKTFQGSGKTMGLIVPEAKRLADSGSSVLIAVPTSEIALEIKQALGDCAFVILSHERLFKQFVPQYCPDLSCPHLEDIAALLMLDSSSSLVREKYCDSCPFRQQCPYPEQYKRIGDPNRRIVVCQHAHLPIEEVMQSLRRSKYFEVLFIDENPIESLAEVVKFDRKETRVLDKYATRNNLRWLSILVAWLRGAKCQGKLKASIEELRPLQAHIRKHELTWRVPELITYHNSGHQFEDGYGFVKFSPVPEFPVTVVADATAIVDQLKIILDCESMETFGENEILDYRKTHPENKVFQVLDGSMARSRLEGPIEHGEKQYEELVNILEFVGDRMRNEYAGRKAVLTLYKDHADLAKKWLSNNYSEIMNRIEVSHMAIGTNKFVEFDVQFLAAGAYLSDEQIHEERWKLGSIKNYWNRKAGLELIYNPSPAQQDIRKDLFHKAKVPVRRIEAMKNHARLAEYPEYDSYEYDDPLARIAQLSRDAKAQQAIRLRFPQGRINHVYVFGNLRLPSMLISDSVLRNDLFAYLQEI